MREGKASTKVPGGKLVRVSVEFEDETILKVTITGDFFMHPENALEAIEESLKGVKLSDAQAVIQAVVDEQNVELLGLTPADIANTIKEAVL